LATQDDGLQRVIAKDRCIIPNRRDITNKVASNHGHSFCVEVRETTIDPMLNFGQEE
jgi:hypothetical protein